VVLGNVGTRPLRSIRVGQVDGEMGRPAWKRLGERPKPLLATRDKHKLHPRLAAEPLRGCLADSA